MEAKKYSPAPDAIAAVLAVGYWYWLASSACPQEMTAIEPADAVRFILEVGLLFLLLRGTVKSAKLLFLSNDAEKPDTKEMGKHWLRLAVCVVLLVLIGALVRDDDSEGCLLPDDGKRFLEEIQRYRNEAASSYPNEL